jgi:hypothetical protein
VWISTLAVGLMVFAAIYAACIAYQHNVDFEAKKHYMLMFASEGDYASALEDAQELEQERPGSVYSYLIEYQRHVPQPSDQSLAAPSVVPQSTAQEPPEEATRSISVPQTEVTTPQVNSQAQSAAITPPSLNCKLEIGDLFYTGRTTMEITYFGAVKLGNVKITINPSEVPYSDSDAFSGSVTDPFQHVFVNVRDFANAQAVRFDPNVIKIQAVRIEAETPQGLSTQDIIVR